MSFNTTPTSNNTTPTNNTTTPTYYAPPPPPSYTNTTPTDYATPSSDGTSTTTQLVGIIVGVVVALGLIVALSIYVVLRRRRRRRRTTTTGRSFKESEAPLRGPNDDPFAGPLYHSQLSGSSASGSLGADKPFPPPFPGVRPGNLQSTFTYDDLKMATDNFSNANLLGQGGFGYVHKGVLPNGKVVAIKQLKAGSGQGESEFQAEVEIISRVHHRHLVSLVGYCTSGAQRLLVYEFVPNKTLEFHLHGDGRPTMDWPTRMKIALGSARGLAYLHEDCHPKIIHRDIKSANILIDNSFEAKVADFGLAKYSLDTDTHVSTRVMGTFGYLAPEYAASGKLTDKSDVFSFGVLLLELITGFRPFDKKNPFDDDSMVDWAKPLLSQALEEGIFWPIVDPKLKEYDSTEMARMVACAAASVRHSARRRPRMSQIVRALEGNMPLEDLNDGTTPGHSSVYGSYGSLEYNSMKYREDMKKSRKAALEILNLGSSEFSGQTSDYGPSQSSSSTEVQQTTQEIKPRKAEKDTEFDSEGQQTTQEMEPHKAEKDTKFASQSS